MNIPNLLSVIRILLVPVLVTALFRDAKIFFVILLIITGLTDFFDGYIARKFNSQTRLGIALDSAADKFLVLSLFIAVLISYKISWIKFILLFSRDIVVIFGRIALYAKRLKIDIIKSISVTFLGKITTVAQLTAIGSIVLDFYSEYFILLAIMFSIATAIQYFFMGYKIIYGKS